LIFSRRVQGPRPTPPNYYSAWATLVTYALRRAFLSMQLLPEHSVAVLLLAANDLFFCARWGPMPRCWSTRDADDLELRAPIACWRLALIGIREQKLGARSQDRRQGLSLTQSNGGAVQLLASSSSKTNPLWVKRRRREAQDMSTKVTDSVDRHVGSRVRVRRLMLGMSQEKLGKALGLTFQQVQKYEKGTNRVGASRIQQICEILQIPVSFLFEGSPTAISKAESLNEAPSPAYVYDFLATSEGLALTRAFTRITDAKLRRSIVDMVEQIAAREAPDRR
jgi:transcriptional regulator with XRE-family HTH domain